MSIDISDPLKLLYFVKKMSEHRYDIRIMDSCVDPNPLMAERQDPYNFTRLQTRERCALEIAAYVFNMIKTKLYIHPIHSSMYLQSKLMFNFSHASVVRVQYSSKCFNPRY